MRSNFITGVCLAAAMAASGAALAGAEPRTACSDTLVRGTYGIQMQGTNIAPSGEQQNVVGVVVRHYDGQGGVIQSDNIKGTITGIVPNRPGSGTYRVNDDCTVDMEFNPAPGIVIREKAVIVDGGRELRSITVFPAGTMVTAVHRKI